jgi:hypothetical protein
VNQSIFSKWLDDYGNAWERQDPDAAAAIFSENGTYAWGPFTEPIKGKEAIRDAWRYATQAKQDNIKFGYEVLAVVDGRGIARWWASMESLPSRTPVRMEGIFLVTLATDGRCDVFREWWNEDPPATGASQYE